MKKKKVKMKSFSCVRLFRTPRTVAYQSPQSMEFSRQEYWNGLPFPSPGGLLDPGIEPWAPALQADALPSEPPGKPMIMYASTLLSPFIPASPSPLCPRLFSVSVSLFLYSPVYRAEIEMQTDEPPFIF